MVHASNDKITMITGNGNYLINHIISFHNVHDIQTHDIEQIVNLVSGIG